MPANPEPPASWDDIERAIVFYHVAKYRGIQPALKHLPWDVTAKQVKRVLDDLEERHGAVLYRPAPFGLTPAGQAYFVRLKKVADDLSDGLARFAEELQRERLAKREPPPPVPAPTSGFTMTIGGGAGMTLEFGPEDRVDADQAARANFPEYFQLASPEDADALIGTVSARYHYCKASFWPRNVPEIRVTIELECNKWEQEFLLRRERVRACPTFARVSAQTRGAIERMAFRWLEFPVREE